MNWIDALQPWIAALQAHTVISHFGDDFDSPFFCRLPLFLEVLYVNFEQPFMDPNRLPQNEELVCEALELLALLAYVDNASWAKLVGDAWPSLSISALQETTARLGLSISFPRDKRYEQGWCQRLLSTDVAGMCSEAYQSTREHLERLIGHDLDRTPLVVPVRVSFGNSRRLFDDEDALQDLESLVLAYQDRDQQHESFPRWPRPLLQMQHTNFMKGEPTTSQELHTVQTAIRCGIIPIAVSLLNLTDDRYAPPSVTDIRAIQDILSCGVHSFPPNDSRFSLWMEVFGTRPSFDMVFSVLLTTSAVCKLEIRRLNGESLEGISISWRWLMVVLFSRFATNKIETMRVEMTKLNDSELQKLREIKNAANPWPLLFSSAASSDAPSSTTVSASTLHFCDPRTEPEGEAITFDEAISGLVVIDNTDPDWVGVLLPGWGCAWVRVTDAVYHHGEAQGSRSCGLHTLVLSEANEADESCLTTFVQLVRANLRSLTIAARYPIELCRATLRALLAACPNLERLETRNLIFTRFTLLPELYVNGSCHANALAIYRTRNLDDLELAQVVQTLSDKWHPMAKALRQLKVTWVHGSDVSTTTVQACIEMLRTNE